MANTVIIQTTDASDGTGFGPGPDTVLTRNDDYLLHEAATQFAHWSPTIDFDGKKLYRFSNLPKGFSGYERARAPPKEHHIDRYLYGHPGGRMQSFREALPHLIYLHLHGTHVGCYCAMCQVGRPKMNSENIEDAWNDARDDVMGKRSKKRKRGEEVNESEDTKPPNPILLVTRFYMLAWHYKDAFVKAASLDAAWASFFWTYGLRFWQSLPSDTRHNFLHQIYELCHHPHLPADVRTPMYRTFAKLQEQEWEMEPEFAIIGPGRRILETAKDDLLRTLPLDNRNLVFAMMHYVAHAATDPAIVEKGEAVEAAARRALKGGVVKEEKLLFACLLFASHTLR